MTVGDLILKLQQYNRDLPVEVFDTTLGDASLETIYFDNNKKIIII